MFHTYFALTLLCLSTLCFGKKECPHADSEIKVSRFCSTDERKPAYARRVAAACLRVRDQKKNNPACHSNGDEERVPDFAAQFTKGLEHDTTTGLLTAAGQASYKELIAAMNNGEQSSFNAITLAPHSRKLVNPQGGLTFSLEGCDSSKFVLPEFPKLCSKKAAALLIELYLMELCRDVYFSDYGTGQGTDAAGKKCSLTNQAAAVLQDLGSAYTGPRNAEGIVDAHVLFRGSTYGNLIGPYLSQFLLLPLNVIPKSTFPGTLGLNNLPQEVFIRTQQQPIPAAKDFVVSFSDFIATQNGTIPQPYTASDYIANQLRYMIDGRDLTGYVHFDYPSQAYNNTLNILFSLPFPFSPTNPYVNGTAPNEGGFVTFGFMDAYAMIGTVLQEAGKASWAQKWRVQRALRPEEFAGLVNQAKTTGTNPFDLNSSLFKCHAGVDVLALIKARNAQNGSATYLLSQAYPEAAPLHPSWPAGHAVIAGACITVIKALFDDTVLIKTIVPPVKPNPADPTQLIPLSNEGENLMTLASELDKLASNIANGRNFAGIHYRADADDGIALGEQVALNYLQDHAATITEQTFTGYELTKLDGTRVRITATSIEPV